MIRNLRLPAALSATGVVASVGAAVVLYVVLSIGPSVPEIEDIQPAAQAPLAIDDDAQALAVKMPSAKEYVEIVRRPIFSPNRRPAQVSGDIQLQTVAFELNLKLIGIIISSGEPIAIVSPGNSTSFVRLTEGDSYQGWVVAGIEPQRVTLRRDAAVEYLELEYDQPPPRKPTAPLREAQQAPQRVPQQDLQPVQQQAQQQKQTQQTQ